MISSPCKLLRNPSTDDSDDYTQKNNYLERYNRRLVERFMNSHPNIFAFVNVIKEEDQYFRNFTREVR
ncbi:hypothetical protein MXB_1295 [Myxobolus squamalis]|nr:hypothetical protein MXB_1295 [Myxobolus squamalis]